MNSDVQQSVSSPAVIELSPPANKSLQPSLTAPVPNEQHLRTIELSSGRIREGFGSYTHLSLSLPEHTGPTVRPAVILYNIPGGEMRLCFSDLLSANLARATLRELICGIPNRHSKALLTNDVTILFNH